MAKITFTSNTAVKAGDQISNPADKLGGFHVAMRDHIAGMNPPKPGESNDTYHYSFNKS